MGFVSWSFPVLSLGAEAFWLIAKDQDQDPLTYGISGPFAYFFTVIATTGEVKLDSPLDYEVQREMQVIVEDRNDNAPVFQNTGFSTNISEVTYVLMGYVSGGGRHPRGSSQK